MEQIILSGVTLNNLLLRIEQIIDARLSIQPQTTDEKKSEYLTRNQVARLLRISLPTLHEWTKIGLLPSYKIGKRVLYKSDEVKESVEKTQFYKHKKGGARL